MKKVLLLASMLSTTLISSNVFAAEDFQTPEKRPVPGTPATVIVGQTPAVGVEDAPHRRHVRRDLMNSSGAQSVARHLFPG